MNPIYQPFSTARIVSSIVMLCVFGFGAEGVYSGVRLYEEYQYRHGEMELFVDTHDIASIDVSRRDDGQFIGGIDWDRTLAMDLPAKQVTSLWFRNDGSTALVHQREPIPLTLNKGSRVIEVRYDMTEWNWEKIVDLKRRYADGCTFYWKRDYTVTMPDGTQRSFDLITNDFRINEFTLP